MGPLFIPPHQPQHTLNPTHRSTPEGEEPPSKPDPPRHSQLKRIKPHANRYSFTTDPTPHYNYQTSALRKYVLLAQDCIAIRFSSDSGHGAPSPLTGHSLFESFTQSNSKCHWNPDLSTSIASLTYNGYIHPSTILLSAPPHHMTTIRNAWSRRILRDPPGLKAEFLGEIEEIVTQPVQQGNFAPLSDSLCWAIADLTDSGHEAFITSITTHLQSTYPKISQPPRDLIYQTLEKLIRDQKIYQTSHGYYIVTPQISSYINYSRNITPCPSGMYGRIYSNEYLDKNYYSSSPSIQHQTTPITQPQTTLKRHNSLKIIRNRETTSYQFQTTPSMGARSLSFRLSKCNSLFDSDKDSSDDDSHAKPLYTTVNQPEKCEVAIQTTDKKKRPSLLTRLFKLTCTSQKTTPLPKKSQWTSLPSTPTPPRNSRTPPSSSPSSTISGIYSSIKSTSSCTRSTTTSKAPRRNSSMYDLINRSWDDKRVDSSDVSR